MIKLQLLFFLLFCTCASLPAQRVKVVSTSMKVADDSLHLYLEMDMNSIRPDRSTAVTLTPLLVCPSRWVDLPPVVISGARRFRFDRRSFALQESGGMRQVTPHLVLVNNRKLAFSDVRYHVSVPYASWMQGSDLLLRYEMKDCCDRRLLGIDTLRRHIYIEQAPLELVSSSTRDDVRRTQAPSVAVPVQAPPAVVVTPSVPVVRDAVSYLPMLSFLSPKLSRRKQNTENVVLYIDYPIGRDDVYPDYKNNHRELDKIDCLLAPLMDDGQDSEPLVTLDRITVCGYSSPDGTFIDNERLAASRSRLFAEYLRNTYPLSGLSLETTSVAEDWDGLERLLRTHRPPYTDAALELIRNYSIFGGREKKLMELQAGVPYRDMLKNFFPRLRRIEVSVQCLIRPVSGDEALRLLGTRPELLSLDEMYEVARRYRPGSDEYREVYEIAACRFPDEVVANVNAASAVMLTGDLLSAQSYLSKASSDARAWNNLGVLALMKGDRQQAAVWFRKALSVEPEKAGNNLRQVEQKR